MITEKDLILVYYEDQPAIFARIEDISPDVKKGWYQVRLLLLNLPVTTVTWILRDAYINGGDFTMNGKRMRFEKIEAPEPEAMPEPETLPGKTPSGKTRPPDQKSDSKVIDFNSLKKPKS